MDHWRDEASAACTGDLSRCSNPRRGNDQLVTLNCTGENCGASSKLRTDPPPKRRHDRDVPPRASGRIADVREHGERSQVELTLPFEVGVAEESDFYGDRLDPGTPITVAERQVSFAIQPGQIVTLYVRPVSKPRANAKGSE